MYKLLIVDDEKWIRKGIISKLDYHKYEFSDIFEADNGKAALDIIEKERPNIVITDIKMPIMDGIQLMKAAEKYKDIKFIIVSGYADFEYARQAINLSAYGYILKPIRDVNFVEVLEKVIGDLDKKQDMSQLIQEKMELEEDNKGYMINQELNEALHNRVEMDMGDYKYCKLGIIHINMDNSITKTQQVREKIKKELRKQWGDDYPSMIIADNYNNSQQIMILVMGNVKKQIYQESQKLYIQIYNIIQKNIHNPIIIGISDISDGINNTLYKQAVDALGQRLVHGYNKIFQFNKYESDNTFVFPKEKLKLLYDNIEHKNIEGIKDMLEEIFSIKCANTTQVKQLWMNIVNYVINYRRKEHIKDRKEVEIDFLSEDVFNQFDNFGALISYLYTTIMDALNIDIDLNGNEMDIIDKAKKYVEQHYNEEITVKDVANRLAINPNYLSTFFKKEVGISFTACLTQKRISKACELLLDTKASVAQISQSVGYGDPQYFYRVFKKNKGITPLAYRNNARN